MIYRGHDIALPSCGIAVVLFSYGFDPEKLRSYTAPITRVATGRTYNHGTLAVRVDGAWYLVESAEDGVTIMPLHMVLDRNKARIEIRPYTGSERPEDIHQRARAVQFTKYDTAGYLHQGLYRLTLYCGRKWNHFWGSEVFTRGIWLGKTGEAAKGRYGCFELIFSILGLPDAYCASGWEFEDLECFGKPVFSEIRTLNPISF